MLRLLVDFAWSSSHLGDASRFSFAEDVVVIVVAILDYVHA